MFKVLATVESIAKHGGPTFVEESVMSVCNIEKARLLLMTQAALLIRMKSPAAAVTTPIVVLKTSDPSSVQSSYQMDGLFNHIHAQSIQCCCLVPPSEGDDNLQVARCVTFNTSEVLSQVGVSKKEQRKQCLSRETIEFRLADYR